MIAHPEDLFLGIKDCALSRRGHTDLADQVLTDRPGVLVFRHIPLGHLKDARENARRRVDHQLIPYLKADIVADSAGESRALEYFPQLFHSRRIRSLLSGSRGAAEDSLPQSAVDDTVMPRAVLQSQNQRVRADQPAVLLQDVPDLIGFGKEHHHIRRLRTGSALTGRDHSRDTAVAPLDGDAVFVDFLQVLRIVADQRHVRAGGQLSAKQKTHCAGTDHSDFHVIPSLYML